MIKYFGQEFNLFGASPWKNGIIHDQGVYPFGGSDRRNYVGADPWSKQWSKADPVCGNAFHKTVIGVFRKSNATVSNQHVHVNGTVTKYKRERIRHDADGWFTLVLLNVGGFQQPWNVKPIKKFLTESEICFASSSFCDIILLKAWPSCLVGFWWYLNWTKFWGFTPVKMSIFIELSRFHGTF